MNAGLWLLLGVVILVAVVSVGVLVLAPAPQRVLDSAEPWWEAVDQILYINLDSRTDRREHMEHMLKETLNLPLERWERLVAVVDSPGWRGCARSHIKALELAQARGYAYVCILEDDFLPLDAIRMHAEVHKAWQHLSGNFDVLMLAQTPISLQRIQASPLFRVRRALATPGYVVRRAYIPVLIEAFQRALAVGQPIDMQTQLLQGQDAWYGFWPPVARQLPGYSDIENKNTDYGFLELDGRMLKFVD